MSDDIATKVRAFFAKYPKKTFSKGQVIMQAHQDPPGVLYLTQGRVTQYDIAASGAVVVVNMFKPPAFFPMSWAVNKTPNVYFFEAASDATAHQAPTDEAVAFVRDNPDVCFDLLSRVYRGTDGLLRRMAHLMVGGAPTRLQFELINVAYRFGDFKTDGSVSVPMSETQLAQQSGLTRETISRHMQTLKNAGLVELQAAGIRIPDLKKLEALLGDEL